MSSWISFPSNKAPRWGCTIAPLLFTIFFTIVVHLAQVKCKKYSDILRDRVRAREREKGSAVKEDIEAWQKEEEVRIPCGMLNADTVGIVSRTALILEKIMAIIVNVCRKFGSTVSK